MQDYAWWWVIAGVLGVAEVMTGTFYLLVLAVSALAASLVAKSGFGLAPQLIAAAVLSLAGWAWLRARKKTEAPASAGLDVGEIVEVRHWKGAVGHTDYRGANWAVEFDGTLAEGQSLAPGRYRIVSMRGNRLIVQPAQPG